MFLRYVDSDEHKRLLQDFQNEARRGHYLYIVTTFKILKNDFYWLKRFKDVYKFAGLCNKCKMFIGKPQLATFPLSLVVIEEIFKKWGMYFMGPLNPPSSARNTRILTIIDYFTKC